jgi:hypothetical protein
MVGLSSIDGGPVERRGGEALGELGERALDPIRAFFLRCFALLSNRGSRVGRAAAYDDSLATHDLPESADNGRRPGAPSVQLRN